MSECLGPQARLPAKAEAVMIRMTAPSCPQCGGPLRSICFIGTGVTGYYCASCRSYLDMSLRAIKRPDCSLAEVTP